MGGALTVRPAARADAAAIVAIHAHYVRGSVVTFEIEPPDGDELARRMDLVLPQYPCLAARGVASWSAMSMPANYMSARPIAGSQGRARFPAAPEWPAEPRPFTA